MLRILAVSLLLFTAQIHTYTPHLKDLVRIVGGVPAQDDEFPFLVLLTRLSGILVCGGVLISDHYVLTAAHCVTGKSASSILVRLGEYDLSTISDGIDVNIAVTKIITHSKFVMLTAYNDIALLRLASPAPRTDRISPICLPPPTETFAGVKGVIAGWGSINLNTGASLPVLQKLDVDVMSHQSCLDYFNGFNIYLNSDKVCAYAERKDSCKGDSGGPLVEKKDDLKNRRLIGIISLGFRCGETNKPGIYTRITSFLSWIKENTPDDTSICFVQNV